jgi:hypothetical protein
VIGNFKVRSLARNNWDRFLPPRPTIQFFPKIKATSIRMQRSAAGDRTHLHRARQDGEAPRGNTDRGGNLLFTRPLGEQRGRHQAIARWTFPFWLWVSVTGVVVDLMRYQVFVQMVAARCITNSWYGRHRQWAAQFCYSERLEGQRPGRSPHS